MKKISLLNLGSLTFLLLSFLLWNGVWFVSAQDSSGDEACDGYRYNKDQMFEDIFEEASVSSSIQIADMFGGNPKEPEVKDLYLNVYKLIDQSPSDEALKITADNYQYTQTELCSILGGSLQPFLDTSTSTLGVAELQELRDEVLQAYNEELERTTREQEMFLDSYGKEIFANGDTSDSSFDVLYDLDILEYLLFGEDSFTTTGGGDINFDSSDNDNPADSDNSSDAEGSEEEASPSDTTSESGSSTETTTETESPTTESSTETESPEATDETYVDPVTCAANDALQAALTTYMEDNGIVDPGDATSSPTAGEDADGSSGDGDGDESDEGTGSSDGSGDSGEDDSDEDLMIASEPHDWEMPNVCGDIFCLIINFKNLDDTTYATSDNCVQCHLDYILEAMRETTEKPLVPGKVSGNLMEPSICKKALVGVLATVDINFTVLKFPISTPPADDIVTNVDFCAKNKDLIDDEENYDLLMNAIFKNICGEDAEIPTTLTDEEKQRLSDAGEDLNNELKAAEMRSSGSVTVDEIFEEALAAHQSNLDAVQTSFENSYINARFEDQATFYKRMEYEMDQMTAYFESFYEMIRSTQETAENIKSRPISTN